MSGGFFDYSGNLDSSADEIKNVIEEQIKAKPDERYQERTIRRLKLAENTLRLSQIVLHRVDWFLSGDDDEDEFNERWDEDLRDYIMNFWEE